MFNLHIETPLSREEYVNREIELIKESDEHELDTVLENYFYNQIDNLSEYDFQKLCIDYGYYNGTDEKLLNEFLNSFKKCEDPEYKWVVDSDCGVFFYFKTKKQAEDKAKEMKEEKYQWIKIRRK